MSTKTSSLNTSANNSPTSASAAMNSSATSTNTNPTVVKIKKELPSDEIKEFAESTMNELLGWYGFDSVDRLDISAKTSKLLQSAALINSQQQQHQQHQLERRRSRSSRANALLHMQQQQQQQQSSDHLRSSLTSHSSNNNNSNNSSSNNNNNSSNSCTRNTSLNCSNYRGNDSTTSDQSSRDDDSKSPNSTGILSTAGVTGMDEKLDLQNCCWCRRPVPENAPEFLTTTDGPRYCSESCFTQSRRASFKKAKTCDWCKHIRHAVSYVDFHDGASQLQFCSDKCLNQYKMQIFCKETQAHLDMNPHLKEQGLEAANNGANLITPDLWLKNCRSRSASPASTLSTSPGPTNVLGDRSASNTPLSPPKLPASSNAQHTNASYKPMISVAPVSKLMSKSPGIMQSRQSPKHNRKKRPLKACGPPEMTSNRSDGKTTNCASGPAPPNCIKPKPLMGPLTDASRSGLNQTTNTPSLTQFAASCVQDLHMSVPPLSPMMESSASQPTTPHNLPPNAGRGNTTTSIPPAFFATPSNMTGAQQHPTQPVPPPGVFPPRPPPFMHNPAAAAGLWPRFLGNFAGLPQPPSAMMPPDLTAFNALIGTPPPVTVMVPYPVIIPLPIPIPVPLPVVEFYKAYLTPEERRKFEETRNIKKESEPTNNTGNSSARSPLPAEEPLDFTKTKDPQVVCTNEVHEPTPHSPPEEFIAKEEEEEAETSPATTSATQPSTPPTDETPATPKILHCVEALPETEAAVANSNDLNDETTNEENNQKLPKLKITRLQTKRTLIQTKESECSRPLRKRKRIIDCDFQKIAANSKETNDEELDAAAELQQHQTTEMELNNKGQHNNNNE